MLSEEKFSKKVASTYKVSGSFFEHSQHLMRAINTCLCCLVVACARDTVLAHHVHHFQVSGKTRLVVFEQLPEVQDLVNSSLCTE